jgi:hypothetical protein
MFVLCGQSRVGDLTGSVSFMVARSGLPGAVPVGPSLPGWWPRGHESAFARIHRVLLCVRVTAHRDQDVSEKNASSIVWHSRGIDTSHNLKLSRFSFAMNGLRAKVHSVATGFCPVTVSSIPTVTGSRLRPVLAGTRRRTVPGHGEPWPAPRIPRPWAAPAAQRGQPHTPPVRQPMRIGPGAAIALRLTGRPRGAARRPGAVLRLDMTPRAGRRL